MNPPNEKPVAPVAHRISETPVEYVEGRTWIYIPTSRQGWLEYYEEEARKPSYATHWTHSDTRPTHDPRRDSLQCTLSSVAVAPPQPAQEWAVKAATDRLAIWGLRTGLPPYPYNPEVRPLPEDDALTLVSVLESLARERVGKDSVIAHLRKEMEEMADRATASHQEADALRAEVEQLKTKNIGLGFMDELSQRQTEIYRLSEKLATAERELAHVTAMFNDTCTYRDRDMAAKEAALTASRADAEALAGALEQIRDDAPTWQAATKPDAADADRDRLMQEAADRIRIYVECVSGDTLEGQVSMDIVKRLEAMARDAGRGTIG